MVAKKQGIEQSIGKRLNGDSENNQTHFDRLNLCHRFLLSGMSLYIEKSGSSWKASKGIDSLTGLLD